MAKKCQLISRFCVCHPPNDHRLDNVTNLPRSINTKGNITIPINKYNIRTVQAGIQPDYGGIPVSRHKISKATTN
jgi:hypothetical protein